MMDEQDYTFYALSVLQPRTWLLIVEKGKGVRYNHFDDVQHMNLLIEGLTNRNEYCLLEMRYLIRYGASTGAEKHINCCDP